MPECSLMWGMWPILHTKVNLTVTMSATQPVWENNCEFHADVINNEQPISVFKWLESRAAGDV